MNKISIKTATTTKVNMALIQNHVPVIQNIEILNSSEYDISDCIIKVVTDPIEAFNIDIPISLVRSGESLFLEKTELNYSWDFFNTCNEKISGSFTISLIQDDIIISELTTPIEFYSTNTWLGQDAPIELLCSHILPNSPGVQTLIKRASDILKESNEPSALDGYQSNSKQRVYSVVQSVFAAVKEKDITYSEPPSSFEISGQKIRDVSNILTNKLATCLDTTLLFAACLEQCGLNTLIFLIHGHAFAGVWLEDKNLPRIFDQDPQFFRKRIELDEILVFETTLVTSNSKLSFSSVVSAAIEHFKNEEKFNYGIDVKYCRSSLKITPLNDFTKLNSTIENQQADIRETVKLENRDFAKVELTDEEKSRKSDLEKWQDKLLDLTFRNKLLNFSNNKSTVQILCNNLSDIEDILAGGTSFELLEKSIQSDLEINRTDKKEIELKKISEGFNKQKLYTNLIPGKFKTTLNSIYRSNRNMLEETGSNTLYLALGLLNWTESDISTRVRQSPILLLPIILTKKYSGGRFSISLRDDETVFNHTLLQKLNRDFDLTFPGLDPLPEDESGVDVNKILNIIRKVIKDKRGWEVKEDSWISEFSFQKYLMWKELNENYTQMLQSPVVKKIMESTKIPNEPSFVGEDKVEDHLPLKKVYCPLPADSSQLAAIFSAAEGKSFVLQGPPGTGKSQTIANMIAHCVGHGKKILFVSEKKVALDVVYKRLKSIGIGQLCLELHSKKSEKKAVIHSFMESLDFNKNHNSYKWETLSEDVNETKNELNGYFKNLHDNSNGDISAYKAFFKSAKEEDSHYIELDIDNMYDFNKTKVHEVIKKLENWVISTEVLDDEAFNAWKFCSTLDWSSRNEDKIKSLIEQFHESTGEIIESQISWSQTDWDQYRKLLNLIITTSELNPAFISSNSWQQEKDNILNSLRRIKYFLDQKDLLTSMCDIKILGENSKEVEVLNTKSKNGFILTKVISSLKLNNIAKKYKNKTSNRDDIINLFIEIKNLEADYMSDLSEFSNFFIISYKSENHSEYISYVDNAETLKNLLTELYSDNLDLMLGVRSKVKDLLENSDILYNENSKTRKDILNLISKLDEQKQVVKTFVTELNFAEDFSNFTNNEITSILSIIKRTILDYREVCSTNRNREELAELGLTNIFISLHKNNISRNSLVKVFEYSFYNMWLRQRFSDSKNLEQFTGNQLNKFNKDFKQSYKKYESETRNALLAEVLKDKPVNSPDILPKSPLGFIRSESKKSRKLAPIRKFLQTISSVSSSLKPCYLMSPLSVSQYLEVSPQFDIVIFDEASQIQPWDAIGSMARGKQVIVVGDSRQLPPTSFFSSSGEDVDDEKMDCESVLDMFGTMFPELFLKWHYRSRSESLIAFSNHHIYGNRLHTFPSSNTNDSKVSLHLVDGKDSYYDRSKSKTNKKEGEAVVNEIFKRLKDKSASNSIGVVTFSSAQSNLIEDLIDEKLLKNPKFNDFFDPGNDEYVFVKNLESVQGDERDIILFSIGYGKDKNGIIYKSFGPLNNSGGERRLNVAITRAREEVILFSNFRSREFDVASSKSEGLALLKQYMAYAEEGHETLFKQQKFDDVDDLDAPFEEEVAKELRKRNWNVKTQIGVGGYRVDLGIVHPEHKGIFIAGIECDGARYHSASSARDRDILRKSVLEGLGWNILRIWSTDWWHNKNHVLDKIVKQLEELILNKNKISNKDDEVIEDHEPEIEMEPEEYNENNEEVSNINFYNTEIVKITPIGEFYDSKKQINQQILHVVDVLGPISMSECFSIIRNSWGFKRIGNKMQEFLESCSRGIYKRKFGDDYFYWKSKDHFDTIDSLRHPTTGNKRHPKTIAPQELMFGFYPIIELNKEVEKQDLFKAVNKKLGFASMSKEVEEHMNTAAKELIKKELIVQVGDQIRLV